MKQPYQQIEKLDSPLKNVFKILSFSNDPGDIVLSMYVMNSATAYGRCFGAMIKGKSSIKISD